MPGKFFTAIAAIEGFYKIGSRPQRNNNPGDIEAGKFASAHGATDSDGRFAIFPTEEAGFEALEALFRTSGYYNLTVAEAINRYAPPVQNNTDMYVKFVCSHVGCSPLDKISGVICG